MTPPADGARINLNPGTLGTPLLGVKAAMDAAWQRSVGWPLGQYALAREALDALHGRTAALFGRPAAITTGTSATMNLLSLWLSAQGKRAVLSTRHEHHGALGAFLEQPAFDVAYAGDDMLYDPDTFGRFVGQERPDVVLLSAVTWTEGRALPVAELVAASRRASPEVFVVVDVAQALGVVPIDPDLGDVVVGSGHKWLGGPPGTGLLWARPGVRLSFAGEAILPGPLAGLEVAGGQDFVRLPGLLAALDAWSPALSQEGSRLATVLARGLHAALGERPHEFSAGEGWGTEPSAQGPMVVIRFPLEFDPYPLYRRLEERLIHLKCIKEVLPGGERCNALRFGVAGTETEERIAHVAKVFREEVGRDVSGGVGGAT